MIDRIEAFIGHVLGDNEASTLGSAAQGFLAAPARPKPQP